MSSLSYCGTDCAQCSWREKMNCKTCKEYRGEMWWGSCRVAGCCIAKGHDDCGQCAEFPCGLLREFAFDAEHGDEGKRIVNLCGAEGLGAPRCGSCCGRQCVRIKNQGV